MGAVVAKVAYATGFFETAHLARALPEVVVTGVMVLIPSALSVVIVAP